MRLTIAVIACMLLLPMPARATCTLTGTTLAFGVYNPSSAAPAVFSGNLKLTCGALSGLSGYKILLTAGVGTFTNRQLRSGGATLNYQIYQDAAHTLVWGDGSGTTSILSLLGNLLVTLVGGTVDQPVYGVIGIHQVADPGSYLDSIIATIQY